jgi:uracil-DNA glycosylase
MDKHAALLELAHRRQAARWPPYKYIGDYQGGAYECEFVSPYTKSARNLNATVMVLLQDWSSDSGLSGELDRDARDLGYTRRSPTNEKLQERLVLHFGFSLRDVYATNVLPFVKVGPMNAPIRKKDLVRAACEFALPQIAIVRPVIAVCLGKAAFNAVRVAAGNNECRLLDEAIASPFVVGSTEIWCQAHTGSIGTNNRNRDDSQRVTKDWARMAEAYNNQMQRTSAAQAADARR